VIGVVVAAVLGLQAVHGDGRYEQALRWSIVFLLVDALAAGALVEFHLHPRRRRVAPGTTPRTETVTRPAG
jgi:hypothetical protein